MTSECTAVESLCSGGKFEIRRNRRENATENTWPKAFDFSRLNYGENAKNRCFTGVFAYFIVETPEKVEFSGFATVLRRALRSKHRYDFNRCTITRDFKFYLYFDAGADFWRGVKLR